MTKKEKLQEEFELKIGYAPSDSMTIKELENSLEEHQEAKGELTQPKPTLTKSSTVNITNGKITKDVSSAQWRQMQDFKHDWKKTINEPKEVKKLKENGKTTE